MIKGQVTWRSWGPIDTLDLGYRSLRSQKTSSFGQTHFCLQKNLFFSSPGALRRLNFFFSIFRIFASGCVKFGQVWTSLDKFGQVWTSLDEFRQVWTSLDKFGQVWTSLNRFEQEVSWFLPKVSWFLLEVSWFSFFCLCKRYLRQVWTSLNMKSAVFFRKSADF